MRIFLRIAGACEIEGAYFAKFFQYLGVYCLLSRSGDYGMMPDLIFVGRKLFEFPGQDCFLNQLGEFIFVVNILIPFLNSEDGDFSRTETVFEEAAPSRGGNGFPTLVLSSQKMSCVIRSSIYTFLAPAHEVHGVVIEYFELSVEFGYVVAGRRAGGE